MFWIAFSMSILITIETWNENIMNIKHPLYEDEMVTKLFGS